MHPRQRYPRPRLQPCFHIPPFVSRPVGRRIGALALRIVTEPMLAHARVHNFPNDAIRLDANETRSASASAARRQSPSSRRAAVIPTTSPTIW